MSAGPDIGQAGVVAQHGQSAGGTADTDSGAQHISAATAAQEARAGGAETIAQRGSAPMEMAWPDGAKQSQQKPQGPQEGHPRGAERGKPLRLAKPLHIKATTLAHTEATLRFRKAS